MKTYKVINQNHPDKVLDRVDQTPEQVARFNRVCEEMKSNIRMVEV